MRKQSIGTLLSIGALVAGVVAVSPACAGLLTYFGADLATGGSVPAAGNAVAARNSFLSGLTGGVGTEDFEGFATGAVPAFNIGFPGSTGSISATLSAPGNTLICGCTPLAVGQFATSGAKWYAPGGILEISFGSPVSAFGFFGTDIGDLGGQLSLALTGSGGPVNLVVPDTISAPNSSGDLLFFGFIDTLDSYTGIVFGNTAGRDFFGFDDMTIGDLRQLTIPEPSGAATFALGLMWIGLARHRARRSPQWE